MKNLNGGRLKGTDRLDNYIANFDSLKVRLKKA